MSERIAFRMTLKSGALNAYRARHDAIWPELVEALHAAGVSDYSIHHDPDSDALFATLVRRADHAMDALPDLPLMRRWWASMADLMATNPDQSPVSVPLETLFHLP